MIHAALVVSLACLLGPLSAQAQLHSIGDPSDAEVHYVELINRARENPAAEGTRISTTTDPDILGSIAFFGVDLVLFNAQMAAYAPSQPLAFHTKLDEISGLHTLDMVTNEFVGHTSSAFPPAPFQPFDTFGLRLTRFPAFNALLMGAGENIVTELRTETGHANFIFDYCLGCPGGMANPPGHRNAILDDPPDFNIVGIGVLIAPNLETGVPNQFVTQNFGLIADSHIAGIAILDIDGDGFYDEGEGLGGVDVTATGTTLFAETTASGAYAIPVPNGTYDVTFMAPDMVDDVTLGVTIAGGENTKHDLIIPYVAPTVSGSLTPTVGLPSLYTLSTVPGTTNYQLHIRQVTTASIIEGAEPGEQNVLTTSEGGYNMIQGLEVWNGTLAFHLAMVDGQSTEIIELDQDFGVTASSSVDFQDQLRCSASTTQFAFVQISTDDGSSWNDVWFRGGVGCPGENSWGPQSASLAAYAGETARIRFIFDTFGTGFPQPDINGGWLVDDILVSNVELSTSEQFVDLGTGTSHNFTPSVAGEWRLTARPQNLARFLPWGPDLVVTASAGGPSGVIKPISVVATSEWNAGGDDGRVANLIDGSGLSGVGPVETQTHDNAGDASTMWHAGPQDAGLGGPTGDPPFVNTQAVVFDLGSAMDLSGVYIWNHNQVAIPSPVLTDRGVDAFGILVSGDSDPLTASFGSIGSFNLNEALGGAEPAQLVPFAAAGARLVKFEIDSVHSGAGSDYVGLSEVRFLPEPSAAAGLVSAVGLLWALARRRRRD
jgi:hypothetical protein